MPTTTRTKTRKLNSKLKKITKKPEPRKPVWNGPEVDGVTQSMLGRYLVCKERFRVTALEGWRPNEGFRPPLEYGNMIHLCEEMHGMGKDWKAPLKKFCIELTQQYHNQTQDVDKWYRVCLAQYPIYLNYWKHHPDEKKRTPIQYEQEFRIPYELPSGRTVNLMGKIDGLDVIGRGRNAYSAMKENKARGNYNKLKLMNDLTFDLQTMTYFVATLKAAELGMIDLPAPLNRIRYNIIRRPLSGGAKGNIRQKKGSKNIPPETTAEYFARLEEVLTEHQDEYYHRFEVHVTKKDVDYFENIFLKPCLEELCNWYSTQTGVGEPDGKTYHYRLPYGIYNNVMEGMTGEIDEYLRTGSTVGMNRVTDMFPELDYTVGTNNV